MKTRGDKQGVFEKVGECLYRYAPNGVYYARIKTDNKEIRQSLRTTDRKTAERELRALKEREGRIDRSQGKVTLEKLCEKYMTTIRHQAPGTVYKKAAIVKRIKNA